MSWKARWRRLRRIIGVCAAVVGFAALKIGMIANVLVISQIVDDEGTVAKKEISREEQRFVPPAVDSPVDQERLALPRSPTTDSTKRFSAAASPISKSDRGKMLPVPESWRRSPGSLETPLLEFDLRPPEIPRYEAPAGHMIEGLNDLSID